VLFAKGDRWIINGHKVFIPAEVGGAAILLANADPVRERMGSPTFMVRPNVPGIPFILSGKDVGHRVMEICQIALDGLELPDDDVLGAVVRLQDHSRGLETNRVGVAAQAVGRCAVASDHALDYAKEPAQFRTADYRASGNRISPSRKWPPELRLRGTLSHCRPTKGARDSPGSTSIDGETILPPRRLRGCALTRYRYSAVQGSAGIDG